jgi:hypothetical protein
MAAAPPKIQTMTTTGDQMNGNNIEGQNLRPFNSSAQEHRDPEPETISKTETVRPATRRRGRPAKVEQKRQTRPHDAEVLRAAAAMLNLTATHDAGKFGVSRQTFSKWLKGETSAPRSVYVMLLDDVIKAAGGGTANVAAAVEAGLIGERQSAADSGQITHDKEPDDKRHMPKVAPRQIAQERNAGAFSEWLSDLKEKGKKSK